ncbi:hypothetical protein RCH09_003696 [Actimicrobium sp. GrIS 1.19]|nr:hypothetical protein [Actimicrobium sp. GrIS 1.19]
MLFRGIDQHSNNRFVVVSDDDKILHSGSAVAWNLKHGAR